MPVKYCVEYTKTGKRKIYYKVDIDSGKKERITIKKLENAGINPLLISANCSNVKDQQEIDKYFYKYDKADKEVHYYKEVSSNDVGTNTANPITPCAAKTIKKSSKSPRSKKSKPVKRHKRILNHITEHIPKDKVDKNEDIIDSNQEYIKFQSHMNMPFEKYNGLSISTKAPNEHFDSYLNDIVSLIGTVRVANSMTSEDVSYSDLASYMKVILGSDTSICSGYRNYYSYSREDLKLFPADITKIFDQQDLDVIYMPYVPNKQNLDKLQDINEREYINKDTVGNLDAINNTNDIGLKEIRSCLTNKNKNDYMLLTLRFHIEPTTYSEKLHKYPKLILNDNNNLTIKEKKVHAITLLINLKNMNPDGKHTGYLLDIFGDSDATKTYAISAFVDLSTVNKIPLFFSVYSNKCNPNFVIQDQTTFQNIWNWFLLSLEVHNPDISRVDIIKKLMMMNKINRLRLAYQFMYYLYQSYGKASIVKFMMDGIVDGPVRGVCTSFVHDIWMDAYHKK